MADDRDRDNYHIDPFQESLPGLEDWAPRKGPLEDPSREHGPSYKVSPKVVARAASRSKIRAQKKRSSKGFQVIELFLIGLALTVGILIFSVAILLMKPSGSNNLLSDLNQNLKATLGPSYDTAEGLVTGVFGRASDGYNTRIKPIPQRVAEFFGAEHKEQEVFVSGDLRLFSRCKECHNVYRNPYRSAVKGIYIDHQLHGLPWENKQNKKEGQADEAEIAEATAVLAGGGHGSEEEQSKAMEELSRLSCRACHEAAALHIQDPKDIGAVKSNESSCYECHKEWDQREKEAKNEVLCRKCHAPGWYFNDAFVAEEKTDRFLAGRKIHKRNLDRLTFSSPSLTGSKRRFCMNCHKRFSFCNDCHKVVEGSHKDRTTFIKTHGRRIIVTREWATTQCWECHNGNWCVRKCHLNGPKERGNPNRAVGRYPIPWKSLDSD